jgi:multidrug transporter EmrE-like cation transporter
MDLFVVLAVLFAAGCHAAWNASIKGTLDPLATTVLIAVGAGLVALPGIAWSGLPAAASWPWLIASVLIHIFYFAGLIESYRAGDLGQVYPIARGAAPLMTATMTTAFVGERLGLYGWSGSVLLAAATSPSSTGAPSDSRCLPRCRSAPIRWWTASACGPRAPATPAPIRLCCSSASRQR